MVQSISNAGLTQGLLGNTNKADKEVQSTLEKISSEKQVNKAADNAAGLAIIDRFASQISGSSQAIRNVSDGVSFTEVAQEGISSVKEDLQRIRELSIQSSNASLSDDDRTNLQSEVGQLQAEVSRRIDQANFNGVDILKTDSTISFQVGANANDTIELNTSDLGSDIDSISRLDISTQAGAQSSISNIDNVLQTLSDEQVDFGVVSNRFESTVTNLQNNLINTQSARSQIEDADTGKEVSELIKGQIQQQSGVAVQSQANTNARVVLQLLS